MLQKIKNSLFYKHLHYLKHYRYFYSLLFCCQHFPWRIAKELPVLFCKDAYAEISNDGQIILSEETFDISSNKFVVGLDTKDFSHQCEKTFLRVEGKLYIKGSIEMRRGSILEVCGTAIIGDFFLLGCNSICRIHNHAEFGDSVRITHECQIFDTNFHPMEDPRTPGYHPISKPIKIGRNCWIGNRTSIYKGTILPDYTSIASNSLVNCDLTKFGSFNLFAGQPVKLIKENITRVWDTKREGEYHKQEFAWYRKRYDKLNK